MTDPLARLNLRPSERRLVVVVGVVLFVVINLVWVYPHFSDWGNMTKRMSDARWTLQKWQTEVDKLPTYESEVRSLEGEGASVPLEDMAVQFLRTVQAQAAQSRVSILGNSRPSVRTNQFFIEQIQNINVQGEEKNMVEFLHNLGSGNSMIRVRDLSIHPDTPRQLLSANIRLVASYQKIMAIPKPAAPVATAPATASQAQSATNQSKPVASGAAPTKK